VQKAEVEPEQPQRLLRPRVTSSIHPTSSPIRRRCSPTTATAGVAAARTRAFPDARRLLWKPRASQVSPDGGSTGSAGSWPGFRPWRVLRGARRSAARQASRARRLTRPRCGGAPEVGSGVPPSCTEAFKGRRLRSSSTPRRGAASSTSSGEPRFGAADPTLGAR
jgi:hypothetical protein